MKKSFGQNLLIDESFLEKILESVDLNPDDVVIEIGAGSGLLTTHLAKCAKKVYAVEPERDILKKLKENINKNKLGNVEIIENSFLKLDLCKISNKPISIIGNIPYNITSKILIKLFGEIDKPALHLSFLKDVFLMLQLEVAERLVAKPNTKAYSPLTLLIQYYTEPEILFKVPKEAFLPIPRVSSAFVRLKVKKDYESIANTTMLKHLIRTSFQQRRKKAINAMEKIVPDKSKIVKIFDYLKLNYNLRAENLRFKDFVNIVNMMDKI